jgi:hypothetical protein
LAPQAAPCSRRVKEEAMNVRTFALVWGIVFLMVAASGLVPGLWQPAPGHYPPLIVETRYGDALGLFPVNILHDLVHLVFGIWGIAAYRRVQSARTYAKSVAVIYALFAVMGLIPGLNTTFGFVPLFGHDIWLHVLLAAPAAYYGFVDRGEVADRR